MKIYFYGKRIHRPTKSISKLFSQDVKPLLIKSGQKTTYRAGSIVLKPSENLEFSNWNAELFNSLPNSNKVRYARPVKSINGAWVEDGYVAWTFLKGGKVKNKFEKKLKASAAFHKLLKNTSKPKFIGIPSNSWVTADLVAWQKLRFDYDEEFSQLYAQINPYLKSIKLPFQLIHGDLSGNFLFEKNLPPAIIDFSPAWAPSGFAEGILLVDAITWENATVKELDPFKKIPNIAQFAWRGVLRRITEQAEHIKWFKKDKEQALEEANNFQAAINYLSENFPL